MLEIPEAYVLGKQLCEKIQGKEIVDLVVDDSPHKYAWYCGNPKDYGFLLLGKTFSSAIGYGGMVELNFEDTILLFADGVNLRYHQDGTRLPKKHQLLIKFQDGSFLSASVQMYGGLWSFKEGDFDNIYYELARERPSPLTSSFDHSYFMKLFDPPEVKRLSLKAFLATEQRIPGLGNGVLQDILYIAKLHPKQKVKTLSNDENNRLFDSLKKTLAEMAHQGGRDTEKDLLNQQGGYETRVSRKTLHQPCSICGSLIKKASYMGGTIYFCDGCQVLS